MLGDGVNADSVPEPKRSRGLLLVVAVVVGVGVVLTSLLSWGHLSRGGDAAVPHPVHAIPAIPQSIQRISVEGGPQPVVADDAAAWVASGSGASSRLWRIDAVTGVARSLPNTSGAEWPAVGEGAAWVTRCAGGDNLHPCPHPSVLKLDPNTGETLASIALPAYPLQIAAGSGAVWVTTTHGLVKIDPRSATIVAKFPVKSDLVGTAAGAVWSTGPPRSSVRKIDPSTGRILAAIRVHHACTFLATDQGVWVASCQGGFPPGADPDILTKIDPSTGKKVYAVPLADWGEMAFADGWLWMSHVSGNHVEVEQRDPATGLPTGVRIVVPPGPEPWGSAGLFAPAIFTAVGDGSFWLTHVDANAVVRVPIATT